MGLSRTCWVTLTGWCSAVCDTGGQDWCQTRRWCQCPALGTAFQQSQVKLPLHLHEGNAMSWAMLSHSHQNPSLTLTATPGLDHPQENKPRADIALQKETTGLWLPALLDQKIWKTGLGAEQHLAMSTMNQEPGLSTITAQIQELPDLLPAPPLPVEAWLCKHCQAGC